MSALAALDDPRPQGSSHAIQGWSADATLHVAIAETNAAQRRLLSGWLTMAGHQCADFDSGDALIRACTRERFDTILVNWDLHGTSGVEVLKRLRMNRPGWLPVVFVSANNSENDIVTALRHGADDYLIKPVRQLELLARLEAIARRGRPGMEIPHVLQMDEFHVDLRGRVLLRHDHPVHLTAKDFDLAALFLSSVGRLLSRQQIHERVWGRSVALTSRSLDTHVCRIRSKLGLTPANGWHLQAVYRNGYRLRRSEVRDIGALPVYAENVREAVPAGFDLM